MTNAETVPVVCPTCRQGDQVANVPAIVSGGTQTGKTAGLSFGMGAAGGAPLTLGMVHVGSSFGQSDLARALSFPLKTRLHQHYSPLKKRILGPVIVVLLFFWVGMLAAAALAQVVPIAGIIAPIGLVVGIVFVRRSRRRHAAAWNVWAGLFYCGRDHVVFQPGLEQAFPPTHMASFITHQVDSSA